jgi:hypothetical protein
VPRGECGLLDFGMGNYFISFRREKDGIWICLESVTIHHPNGSIEVTPGRSFKKGDEYMGIDLASWLDEQLISALKKRS